MTEKRIKSWMPIYWGDYFGDTQHLTCEEHGAYLLLIARYWQTGEPLPDDDAQLQKFCKLTRHKWKKVSPVIRSFFEARDGKLFHVRIHRELEKAAEKSRKQSDRAKARWVPRHEGGECRGNAGAMPTTATATATDSSVPSESSPSVPSGVSKRGPPVAKPNGVAPWEVQQAVDLWNGLADEIGLPRCAKLTEARRKKLRNRIRDAGGLPGWQKALEKIRGDPFYRGDNKRGWRCGIDFLLQESSFTKLMEGYYDFGRQEYVFDAGDLARRAGIAGDDSDLFSASPDVRPGIEPKGNGSEEH